MFPARLAVDVGPADGLLHVLPRSVAQNPLRLRDVTRKREQTQIVQRPGELFALRLTAIQRGLSRGVRIPCPHPPSARASRTIWIASSCDGATTMASTASLRRRCPSSKTARSSRRHISSTGRR